MVLSIREIAELLLKEINEELKNEPPGTYSDLKDIICKNEFKEYANKITDILDFLIEERLIEGHKNNDLSYHMVRLTIRGKLHLEEIERTNANKTAGTIHESYNGGQANEDWQFYNNYNFDIIKIKKHLDSIEDNDLKISYLNWLSKEANERFNERLANKSKEEKRTKNYRDGLFTHKSIVKFLNVKLKYWQKGSSLSSQNKKKRVPVPSKIRALLQKEINSKCPFCQSTDVDHFEIHHIDGIPSNNKFNNLLMLCPTCHSKIEKA